jgi:Transposase IS116/IS110/IS902 family
MIGNGHEFRCARQFAAWLGLTPGQYSSGGKTRLGGITKAGDAYLRTLLILGARAVLAAAKNKADGLSRWATALEQRRGYWKAVVAIAAKNARMCWAVLARGEQFKGERLAVPRDVTVLRRRRAGRPAIRRQASASGAAATLRCGCWGGWEHSARLTG